MTGAIALVLLLRSGDRRQPGHKSNGADPGYPYKRAISLCSTDEELQFFQLLRRVVGTRYLVMAKVRLLDLVEIEAEGTKRDLATDKILGKYVDFVLLTPDRAQVALAINIETPDGHQHDGVVETVIQKTGLPLLRVQNAKTMSAQELIEAVNAAMLQRGVAGARS